MSARCLVTARRFARRIPSSTRPGSHEAVNFTAIPQSFATRQHGQHRSCGGLRPTTGSCPTYLTRRSFSVYRRLEGKMARAGNEEEFAKALSSGKYIPDELLEHYPETTEPPTRRDRDRACHFFDAHKPVQVFVAAELHQVTVTGVPEVAVMGRSNVGKSQLVNRLLGWKVTRTSSRPGKTSTMNGWGTGAADPSTGKPYRLTIVDMPGYGKGSHAQWGVAIQEYLAKRRELRRVLIVINIEHGVLESDRRLLEMLREAAIPHQMVLTKADKLLMPKNNKPLTRNREARLYSPENLAEKKEILEKKVAAVREAGKGEPGQISAMDEVVICSSECKRIVGQPPERYKTVGITGLRCAVLRAIGYR